MKSSSLMSGTVGKVEPLTLYWGVYGVIYGHFKNVAFNGLYEKTFGDTDHVREISIA